MTTKQGKQRKSRRIYQAACLSLAAAVVYTLTAVGCTLPRSGGLSQNCTTATECDDGTPCTDDACGEDGFCVYTPVDNSGSVIQVPYDCKSISCEAGREVASPDDRDLPTNPCVDASCNNGTLTETPKAEGEACTLGAGNGVCEMGECVVRGCMDDQSKCDDDNGCTVDSCDQTEDKCVNSEIDGEPAETDVPADCRIILCVMGVEQEINDNNDTEDDLNPCTTDTCANGNPVHDNLARGTVCGNSGGQDLVCNDSGGCVGCNQPTDCNGTDTTCQTRTCINETCGVEFAPTGTFVQNTGQCTELQCDGAGGTMSANKPQNTACNDGQFCTMTDRCNNNGGCIGATNPCQGPDGDGDCSETCNENANNCNGNDPNNTACTDGQFCTQTDTCQGGTCTGTGNPCAGHNTGPNCNDSCNEGADNCTANDNNGTGCNDNLFCTQTDTCNNGSCTGSGNPCPGHNIGPNCNDSCNEGADNCTANDSNGTGCDDGAYCNGADTCQGGGCTNHAGNPCSGHNVGPNCNDSCNEGADNCTANDNNGTGCDDGAYCNGADTCQGGGCTNHAGNPCAGHNTGPNCDDSCNEGNDDCTANDAQGTACSVNSGTMCDNMGQCI